MDAWSDSADEEEGEEEKKGDEDKEEKGRGASDSATINIPLSRA